MEKQQKRSTAKRTHILRTALELFKTHGVERISVDEIASTAHVSKATLYKYFSSKDSLYQAAVDGWLEETLATVEAVFHSEIDFLEKLRFALLTQNSTAQWVDWTYLFEIWEREEHKQGHTLRARVATLIGQFVEEGKSKGFLDPTLSLDVILLYAEIFRAGFKTTSSHSPLESLVHLFFYGLMKR
jgi:AcrR family transcriptional regulator